MTDTPDDPDTPDEAASDPADPRHDDTVQQELPFDDPVPFRLTMHGRRLVAPDDEPTLRVVPRPTTPRAADERAVVLDSADGATRARARAMRRGGMHTLDIAERLAVDPLHVERWVEDLPVPARPRRRLSVVSSGPTRDVGSSRALPDAEHSARDPGSGARWRAARDEARAEAERALDEQPALRAGIGLVAGLLEPDHHALLLTGDDLAVVAAAWRWVAATLGPGDAPLRLLVRHDPSAASDTVAHEVAAALAVEHGAVTTSRDAARTGRSPAVRLRVADPELAGRVSGWRRALLVAVDDPTSGSRGSGTTMGA